MTFAPGPPIIDLHLAGGPAAVARLVVAVIVDSIKASIFRSWPHIGIKVPEIVPSFADGYSPAAIVIESVMVGVVAAISHSCPTAVFGPDFTLHHTESGSSVIKVVPRLPATGSSLADPVGFLDTAATDSPATFWFSHVIAQYDFLSPAVT